MNNQESLRAFTITSTDWNQHRLTFVSMEEDGYAASSRICPPERYTRLGKIIGAADLSVAEYFPPELQHNIYDRGFIGGLIERTAGKAINRQYGEIARIGQEMGARFGVADIANTKMYAMYEVVPQFFLGYNYLARVYDIEPGRAERYFPTAPDARRMLTAEAIVQETQRHPEGTHIAYIAAPAHTNRVAQYILKQQTSLDRARLALYRHLPGVDKSLRVYQPTGNENSWELVEKHPIEPRKIDAASLETVPSASTN